MQTKLKNNFTKTWLILFGSMFSFEPAVAQYAPPAGQVGTTAIYKDSSAFVNWATGCNLVRGFQDISNQSLGFASAGDATMAVGKAQTNGVVSLGDRGIATCTFLNPITNGPGFDFAVFENGFDDYFLELAFVEVSSDGVNFTRFPSHSLTTVTVQTGSFGSTDATSINNLAGKYRGGFGTPFDLQELASAENLNVNSITHVRVIDVIGSVNDAYATLDSFGNKVNDPWPTPFPSGGFDLDAIGVIHEQTTVGIPGYEWNKAVTIFPNPLRSGGVLNISVPTEIVSTRLSDLTGKVVVTGADDTMSLKDVAEGIYILLVETAEQAYRKKIIVR